MISLMFQVTFLLFMGILNSSAGLSSCRKRVSVVTGSSGYLGREVVHSLLQLFIPVEGILSTHPASEILCLVRQRRVEEEEQYWRDVCTNLGPSCSGRVKVMPYDMLDGGKTLSDALHHAFAIDKGKLNSDNFISPNRNGSGGGGDDDSECCIYHIASVFSKTEDHRRMALENVKGAVDLIETVAKFPISRTNIVFTSSMAAVRGPGQIPGNSKWYTHEDWNSVSEIGANWGSSYQWSKAESEKRSWELAKKHGVSLVVLCPSFIFGPPTDGGVRSSSYSLSLVRSWMNGESPVQSRLCVDIRDAARAHVMAGNPTDRDIIGERIILSHEARTPAKNVARHLAQIARETGCGDPSLIVSDQESDNGIVEIGEKEVQCAERVKTFLGGLKLRPVEKTMGDMARALYQVEKDRNVNN